MIEEIEEYTSNVATRLLDVLEDDWIENGEQIVAAFLAGAGLDPDHPVMRLRVGRHSFRLIAEV